MKQITFLITDFLIWPAIKVHINRPYFKIVNRDKAESIIAPDYSKGQQYSFLNADQNKSRAETSTDEDSLYSNTFGRAVFI